MSSVQTVLFVLFFAYGFFEFGKAVLWDNEKQINSLLISIASILIAFFFKFLHLS